MSAERSHGKIHNLLTYFSRESRRGRADRRMQETLEREVNDYEWANWHPEEEQPTLKVSAIRPDFITRAETEHMDAVKPQ